MRSLPVRPDLTASDLSCGVRHEPRQNKVLRANVFVIELAQRECQRSRHTLDFSHGRFSQAVAL
jgi:hypothetical protein